MCNVGLERHQDRAQVAHAILVAWKHAGTVKAATHHRLASEFVHKPSNQSLFDLPGLPQRADPVALSPAPQMALRPPHNAIQEAGNGSGGIAESEDLDESRHHSRILLNEPADENVVQDSHRPEANSNTNNPTRPPQILNSVGGNLLQSLQARDGKASRPSRLQDFELRCRF